jgi:hypothetical protein
MMPRIARLIRTIDDVQVRQALWLLAEVDAAAGEVPVADEIEALETHELCASFGCMELCKYIVSALLRDKREASLEGCRVGAEAIAAFLWKVRAQFLGHSHELRLKRLRLKNVLHDEASQFDERVEGGFCDFIRGMGSYFEFLDPAFTDERTTIIRLGLKKIEIASNAPGQWRGAGQTQSGDKVFGDDGRTRALQSVSHSRDQIAPVIEPSDVDRDPFKLCYTGDALFDVDRTVVSNGDKRHRLYATSSCTPHPNPPAATGL